MENNIYFLVANSSANVYPNIYSTMSCHFGRDYKKNIMPTFFPLPVVALSDVSLVARAVAGGEVVLAVA